MQGAVVAWLGAVVGFLPMAAVLFIQHKMIRSRLGTAARVLLLSPHLASFVRLFCLLTAVMFFLVDYPCAWWLESCNLVKARREGPPRLKKGDP